MGLFNRLNILGGFGKISEGFYYQEDTDYGLASADFRVLDVPLEDLDTTYNTSSVNYGLANSSY